MLSALISIFGTGFVGSVLIIVFKRVLDRHDAERQVQDKVQANQQQAQQAEQVAIKEGVVALLHDRLYAMYGECAIVGHASVETLRNADYLYRHITSLEAMVQALNYIIASNPCRRYHRQKERLNHEHFRYHQHRIGCADRHCRFSVALF